MACTLMYFQREDNGELIICSTAKEPPLATASKSCVDGLVFLFIYFYSWCISPQKLAVVRSNPPHNLMGCSTKTAALISQLICCGFLKGPLIKYWHWYENKIKSYSELCSLLWSLLVTFKCVSLPSTLVTSDLLVNVCWCCFQDLCYYLYLASKSVGTSWDTGKPMCRRADTQQAHSITMPETQVWKDG